YHVTESAVAVEAVGHALRSVGGIHQIAGRGAWRTDHGAGCGGVGVAGDLDGIAVGRALNAEAVSASRAGKLGGECREGCRMFTKVQRTEVDAVLVWGSVYQAAVGQRQGGTDGPVTGHRL